MVCINVLRWCENALMVCKRSMVVRKNSSVRKHPMLVREKKTNSNGPMTSAKLDSMVCKRPTLMGKSEWSNRVPHISLHVCNKQFIYRQCVGQELTLDSLVRMGLGMVEAGEGGVVDSCS